MVLILFFLFLENANPGDCSIVKFTSEHIKKFETKEKYSISSFVQVVAVPLDELKTTFYFPFGAKKNESFIVSPFQFLINRRSLQRLSAQ